MTYDELSDFLLHRMSMRHIYQPLVIRTLLENDGRASVREIAREFLSYDEAQVEYYCKIVKRWPKVTLAGHGVISANERGYFRLNVESSEMTEEQKNALIEVCNNKIREFIAGYEGIIGDYRYNPDDLSSSSIRYLVLRLAHGRCALCGASVKDTPLDVDHIIPRNKGGTNDITNLQALCYRCNRAKRDRDAEDFRNFGEDTVEENCPFCILGNRIVGSYNTANWIFDGYPVTKHHSLVIPKRHISSVETMTSEEMGDVFLLTRVAQANLRQRDSTITGFNIGVNQGIDAGQTVPHIHFHLIPRRKGDVPNPRGGVRGIIPGAADY